MHACVWRPVRVQNQDAVRFLVYERGMGCFGPPDSHTLCMAWRPAHMVKFQTLELNMGDAGPSVASFLILCTCQQRGGPAHD